MWLSDLITIPRGALAMKGLVSMAIDSVRLARQRYPHQPLGARSPVPWLRQDSASSAPIGIGLAQIGSCAHGLGAF